MPLPELDPSDINEETAKVKLNVAIEFYIIFN